MRSAQIPVPTPGYQAVRIRAKTNSTHRATPADGPPHTRCIGTSTTKVSSAARIRQLGITPGRHNTHHGVDADQSAGQRVDEKLLLDDDGFSDDPVDLIGRTPVSEMVVQLTADQYEFQACPITADHGRLHPIQTRTHQACKVLRSSA
jgi:hypothetical protein